MDDGRPHTVDKPESALSVSDYEDAVLKAERHFESSEGMHRNYASIVSRVNSNLEEKTRREVERNNSGVHSVLGRISSLVGDIFSGTNSAS